MALIESPETERRRLALCEWLTANGISPGSVPEDSKFRIFTQEDGQRIIDYTAYVLSTEGAKMVDPDDKDQVWQEPRSAPCVVEPPTWLRIPGAKP